MWHDSVCNTVQEPTVTSTIVAKKTTTWGESGLPSEFLGRHYHIVASIGQLLDLKLRRQLASMVQARSRGLVETIEAAPSSQTDTTTNNIYN